MDTRIPGHSIVACRPVRDGSGAGFHGVDPMNGERLEPAFEAAGPDLVRAAAQGAGDAFASGGLSDPGLRARALRLAAERILALGTGLTDRMARETGLAAGRCASERDRTVFQLRTFADLVDEGGWIDAVIDHGDPARAPLPKPDVRRMLRPLGPVAVFGAGNFPLAFGVAGGDTASALAAGCPVVVKGHPGHPGTGELVARAFAGAVLEAGLPAGAFSFLHSGGARGHEVGAGLVRHPAIRAAGFTGSKAGGLALARLAAERPEPIPFFAEMGSLNPTFVLEDALLTDGPGIAAKLAGAILGSSGQLCTKPGIIAVVWSDAARDFETALVRLVVGADPAVMLDERIRCRFDERTDVLRGVPLLRPAPDGTAPARGFRCAPHVDVRCAGDFLGALDPRTCSQDRVELLAEEWFGPGAIVLHCFSDAELLEVATVVPGSLAASVFAGPNDGYLLPRLAETLAARAGRVVFNGVTTGVEVCAAMHHGGPFPATNRPETTSVGAAAIRRWCRPVAWQNAPDALLPPELQEANPRNVFRVVDGHRRKPGASNR